MLRSGSRKKSDMCRDETLNRSTIYVHKCFSEARRELVTGNSDLRTRLERAFVAFTPTSGTDVPKPFDVALDAIQESRERLQSMSIDDLKRLAQRISEFYEALSQYMDKSPEFADFDLIVFLDEQS